MPCLEHTTFHLDTLETLYQFTTFCDHQLAVDNFDLHSIGSRAAITLRDIVKNNVSGIFFKMFKTVYNAFIPHFGC